MAAGDLDGGVLRPCVDDDDLVSHAGNALQAARQQFLLVAGNDAQAQPLGRLQLAGNAAEIVRHGLVIRDVPVGQLVAPPGVSRRAAALQQAPQVVECLVGSGEFLQNVPISGVRLLGAPEPI